MPSSGDGEAKRRQHTSMEFLAATALMELTPRLVSDLRASSAQGWWPQPLSPQTQGQARGGWPMGGYEPFAPRPPPPRPLTVPSIYHRWD
jgi:hypothetical protein